MKNPETLPGEQHNESKPVLLPGGVEEPEAEGCSSRHVRDSDGSPGRDNYAVEEVWEKFSSAAVPPGCALLSSPVPLAATA